MPTVMPSNRTAPKGTISDSAPPTPPRKRAYFGERKDDVQNRNGLTGPPMQTGAGKGSMFADGRKGMPTGQPQGDLPPSPNYPKDGPGPRSVSTPGFGASYPTPNYPLTGPGPATAHGQPQGELPPSPNYPKPMLANGRKGQAQGMPPAGNPRDEMFANGRKPAPFQKMPPRGGAPMQRMPQAQPAAPMMADGGMSSPSMIGGGGEPDADDTSMLQGGQDDGGAASAQMSPGAGQLPMIKPESVFYHDQPTSCKTCQFNDGSNNCSVLQMQISPDGGCTAWEQGGAGEPDQDDMPPSNGGAPHRQWELPTAARNLFSRYSPALAFFREFPWLPYPGSWRSPGLFPCALYRE